MSEELLAQHIATIRSNSNVDVRDAVTSRSKVSEGTVAKMYGDHGISKATLDQVGAATDLVRAAHTRVMVDDLEAAIHTARKDGIDPTSLTATITYTDPALNGGRVRLTGHAQRNNVDPKDRTREVVSYGGVSCHIRLPGGQGAMKDATIYSSDRIKAALGVS